jgi:hypothetical protein
MASRKAQETMPRMNFWHAPIGRQKMGDAS